MTKTEISYIEEAPEFDFGANLHSTAVLRYEIHEGALLRDVIRRDGSLSRSTIIRGGKGEKVPGNGSEFDRAWLRANAKPDIANSREKVTIADLFCGCGGMSLGIEEACRGLEKTCDVAFACEIEPSYFDVYRSNLNPRIACGDPIEKIFDSPLGSKLSTSERRWAKKIGPVVLAAGGPPCQGHSDLNNYTRRNDPRNSLYLRMARFAEVVSPEHVIIENVLGVRHDKSGVFNLTVKALTDMGYAVDTPIIKSEEIGVAQRRHRAFIVASKSVDLYPGYFDEAIKSYQQEPRSVAWACSDLLRLKNPSRLDETSNLTAESKKRVDWMFENDAYDLPDRFRPSCHRDKQHTYKSVYGRLFWDQPAWTLTTGFLVMGQGRYIHPLERRVITPHEGARLQFFPDFFDFGIRPRGEYAKMIGNAVPPKLAYVIATELLR
jgi:DNA (cytosine-5)-methyltransferase 1